MAMDNISILIQSVLKSDQQDMQKQIDALSKKVQINLKPRIDFDEKVITKLKTDIDKLSKNIKINLQFDVDKNSTKQAEDTIQQTTKKMAEASKTAIRNADKGDIYKQFTQQINKLNQEITKNGGQVMDWAAQTKAKTGEITGATIKYADSLGRVRTELYSVVKEYESFTDKKGKERQRLVGIDLEKTNINYSQSISKQQSDNYIKAKSELTTIQNLTKEKLRLDEKDSATANLIAQQIKAHEKTLSEILNSNIKISKEESATAISKKQQLDIDRQRKKNAEEILLIETKAKDVANRKTSTTTSGARNLGEEVVLGKSINFDASKKDLNEYARAVAGAGAEWTRVNPKIDELGNKLKEVNVRVKDGKNHWQNYTMTLDESSGKLFKVDKGLSDVSNRQLTFSKNMSIALQRIVQWGAATTLIYGSLKQIREGVTFLNELNASMTNVRMITGASKEEVATLTKEYSKLAGQLHETTSSIMKGSEEFLRAGFNQKETAELLKASTVMSKIAGQDQATTAEQLIAITNSYKLSIEEVMGVVDKLTTVDNMSATSTKELGTAIQRTASSAQLAGVPFEKLVSYIATVSSVSRKSASTIGESFKTIFARFQDVKGGKEFDAENEPISNVERDFAKYAKINIRETSGEFKDFGIVIEELASKWSKLSEVDKNATTKALAGVRQRETMLVLMNNMSKALELESAQTDSSGSAMNRYGAFAEGTQSKLNDLKNAAEQMWMKLLSSDAINNFAIKITDIVKGLDSLLNSFNAVGLAIGVLAGVMAGAFVASMLTGAIAVEGINFQLIKMNLLSAGIPLLIGAAVTAVGYFTNGFGLLNTQVQNNNAELEKNRQQASALSKQHQDSAKSIKSEIDETDTLTKRYQELTKDGITPTKEQKEELRGIEEKLAQLYPTTILGLDDQGKAYTNQISAVDALKEAKYQLYLQEVKLAAIQGTKAASLAKTEEKNAKEQFGFWKSLSNDYSTQIDFAKSKGFDVNKLTPASMSVLTSQLISKGYRGDTNYSSHDLDLANQGKLSDPLLIKKFFKEASQLSDEKLAGISSTWSEKHANSTLTESSRNAQIKELFTGMVNLPENQSKSKEEVANFVADLINGQLGADEKISAGDVLSTAFSPIISSNTPPKKTKEFSPDGGKDGKGGKAPLSESPDLIEKERYFTFQQAEIEAENKILDIKAKKALLDANDEKNVSAIVDFNNQEIEALKNKQQALQNSNDERRKELSTLDIVALQLKADAKLTEVNAEKDADKHTKLKAQYDDINKNIKRYYELINTDIPRASNEWLSIQKEINDTIKDSNDLLEKSKKEGLIKSLEEQIKLTDKAKDASKDAFNEKISQLQSEKDSLESVNKEKERQNALAEKDLAIAEKRKEIQNLMNDEENYVNLYQNGQWQRVVDSRKASALNKDIADLEKSRKEIVDKQKQENEIANIERQINHQKRLQDQAEKRYSAELEYYKELEQKIKDVAKVTDDMVNNVAKISSASSSSSRTVSDAGSGSFVRETTLPDGKKVYATYQGGKLVGANTFNMSNMLAKLPIPQFNNLATAGVGGGGTTYNVTIEKLMTNDATGFANKLERLVGTK